MVCKRLHTELRNDEDLIENVTDPLAYQEMFPVHKVSKFGQGKLRKQLSKKLSQVKNETDEDYIN